MGHIKVIVWVTCPLGAVARDAGDLNGRSVSGPYSN